jgi:hypothetical protein
LGGTADGEGLTVADLTLGQVELGGLLLEDPYLVQRIEGLGRPEVRTSESLRTGRDGLVPGQRLLGGRTIPLELVVIGWNQTGFGSALDALRNLSATQDVELRLRLNGIAGGNTVRTLVHIRRDEIPLESEYTSYAVPAALELRATDPRLYSDGLTTVTLLSTSVTGGLSFPWTFPITFGGAGNAGAGNIVNAGNFLAPVSVEIHGPITKPRLRNETTNQEIFYNGDLAAGEWLAIDTEARTVLLQGTANRYWLLGATQWWGLVPGTNQIRFSGATSAGALAHITYRSAWL